MVPHVSGVGNRRHLGRPRRLEVVKASSLDWAIAETGVSWVARNSTVQLLLVGHHEGRENGNL